MPKSPRFPPNAVRVIEVLAFPSVQLLDESERRPLGSLAEINW